MEHEKTAIYFNSKGKSYRVEYDYGTRSSRDVLLEKTGHKTTADMWTHNELQARVYENGEVIRLFRPLPYTKTNNPTKTQAKELITIALKEIKQKQKTQKNV